MDEVSYHGARLPWKEATGSKCQGVLKPVIDIQGTSSIVE